MKKIVLGIFTVAVVVGVSLGFKDVAKAYANRFYVEIDNNVIYTTDSEKIDVSYSNSLHHSIVMYGTDKTDINNIEVILQRKSLLSWGNAAYVLYVTMSKNQGFAGSFGTFNNGTFRFKLDTQSYPYQGIYYGDIEHFAV